MKKVFLLALSVVFIGTWCSEQNPNLPVAAQNTTETTKNARNPRKEISFENVSFDYDENWIAEVKSEIIPASPLENKDDKPDYVKSKTVNFKLTYSNAKYDDDDAAEISVYKIEEYKNAFSPVPGYVTEKEIRKLRKILRKSSKIKPSGSELPYVPWVDAHQVFHAKTRIINFQNGKGLLFLTQIGLDAVSVVNGDELHYCFQGFTDDGQYFVFADFPVSAKGLPEGDDAEEYWTIERYQKNRKKYEKYIDGTAEKLEDFSNDKFTPNLAKIEDILSSLKIR
jgi:hypothetical protein